MEYIVILLALCCCARNYVAYGFIQMRGCLQDHVNEVTEGSLLKIYANTHRSYDERGQSTARWVITRLQNKSTLHIECQWNGRWKEEPCNIHYSDGIHARYGYRGSSLIIPRVDRSVSNISLTITARPYSYKESISCLLDVISPAEVDSCQYQINKQKWSVEGFCDVTKVYSSRDTFQIRIDQGNRENSQSRNVAVNKTKHLTSYTNTSSGLTYYGGKFPFSDSLLPDSGNLTISVTVFPGNVFTKMPSLHIESPDDPALMNCDQVVIVEGGNSSVTPCVCTVASLGSPSGRLRWLSYNSVLMTGEYGVRELPFPYEKVNRTRLEQAMSCQVDWIVSRNSTSFTPEFAVGPDTAVIFSNMTLLCTSQDVHPRSALDVTWGGLCEGQKGRTCSLKTSDLAPGETVVTCSATNQMLPHRRATAKWFLKVDNGYSQKSAEERSFWEGVSLGVGGTLFVVLVVVAVLLVLLRRRGLLPTCQCCNPTYVKPSKRKQQQEEKEHTYTEVNIYEPVGAATASTGAGSPPNPGRPGVPARGADNVYVIPAADLGRSDVISGADAVYVNPAVDLGRSNVISGADDIYVNAADDL